MATRRKLGMLAVAAATASMALAGCGGSGGSGDGNGPGKVTHLEGAPSWCGTKKIAFALLDGFGGNSWRLVTTASGKEEARSARA